MNRTTHQPHQAAKPWAAFSYPEENVSSLDYTAEDLAERNGARLLATQIQTLQREYNESVRRHYEELHRIRLELTQAEKIGLAVIRAKEQGRKTVRIDSLIQEQS